MEGHPICINFFQRRKYFTIWPRSFAQNKEQWLS
jgi:hypothetical protein